MKSELKEAEVRGEGSRGRKLWKRLNWAGVGVASGAIAGAALGAVEGPIVSFLGLMTCAFVGGLAGKGVTEKMEPPITESYLKGDYSPEMRLERDLSYQAEYAAYRAQQERFLKERGAKYLEVQPGFIAQLRDVQTFPSNLG